MKERLTLSIILGRIVLIVDQLTAKGKHITNMGTGKFMWYDYVLSKWRRYKDGILYSL